jgi:hypothetical protein
LFAVSAARSCDGVTLSAAIRSGFNQARRAKVRAPRISARCTPLIADSAAARRGSGSR